MTQIVPFKQKIKTVQEMLVKGQKQLELALPKHLTADRMVRIVLTEIQKTPKLLDCDQRTLMGAVVQAAQLGLEPGLGGQAYLVPFKGKVQMIPGYRGLLALVYRTGQLESFEAAVVRDQDKFEYERGLNPILRHKPAEYQKLDDSQITHAYAIARLKGGSFGWDVMTRAEIDAVRARSMAANNGPWVTDFAEMAKKTVTKRLTKYLPMSIEMQRAIELDDLAQRGIPQGLENLVEIEMPEPDESESAGEISAGSTNGHSNGDAPAISPAQVKRLFAIAQEKGRELDLKGEDIVTAVLSDHGIGSAKDITTADYDGIVALVQSYSDEAGASDAETE